MTNRFTTSNPQPVQAFKKPVEMFLCSPGSAAFMEVPNILPSNQPLSLTGALPVEVRASNSVINNWEQLPQSWASAQHLGYALMENSTSACSTISIRQSGGFMHPTLKGSFSPWTRYMPSRSQVDLSRTARVHAVYVLA